jgi:signal transduction histidine kinase
MLEMLEDNALVLCAILSVAVACILLMAAISVLRRIQRLQPRRTASAAAGSPAVQDAPFAALLAINPSERCVCAVSGPFEALTGISAQQILSDAYSLDGCFRKDTRRNLRETFDLWDRRSLLQTRCDVEHVQTKFVRHCSFKVWPSDASGLWVAELRDITEVADLIEGLERKAEEAEASEKAKLRFLSDMSHEIRTPMNGIMGTLALAQIHADEPDATREYLHQADDLTQYLLSIINNVLERHFRDCEAQIKELKKKYNDNE